MRTPSMSRRSTPALPATRRAGIGLATATACTSGIAVFVNSYGVRRFPDATSYTTAKNVVAGLLLGALLLATSAMRVRDARIRDAHPQIAPRRRWIGMAAVAVVGGSVPFVLFFEGLARATSTDAAFLHKTMVVWVAILAVPILRERVGPLHVAALALLVSGQALLTDDLWSLEIRTGELMILLATLLWAVEVIVAKRMLAGVSAIALGTARMAGGAIVLLGWTAVRGDVATMLDLDAAAWGWAAVTGAILFVYVATWYAALARAQAVDVTAVLVFGAVITALLDRVVNGVLLPDPTGLALLGFGAALVLATARRAPTRRPAINAR